VSTPLDHRHSPTRIWVDPPGRYETVNGAIYIPTPGMPGFVAGVGKRRQAPNRCRFGCLGLGRKICTSCRTAATSTCFPASSTRHRSRRLMRIGRHREGSAVPAGRARQGDSRKIPINVMAVTSTSSTIRRHDKPYDPSSYISGTQGDNKTNGENNRTRGPHAIVDSPSPARPKTPSPPRLRRRGRMC
jgi:hypothetical protein